MKTAMSRFHIHDELTAPEGSVPVLRGALATGGQLPNFLGVLAGSPAVLRGYARFRSELRHGTLTLPTIERIALAVADHYQSEPGIATHSRTARQGGLALDEVALAREWDSRDER
jgi:alkylhydroperoxidase family enzyme